MYKYCDYNNYIYVYGHNGWAQMPYPKELKPYVGIEINAAYWPMNYFAYRGNNVFTDFMGNRLYWDIKNPKYIDFNLELNELKLIQSSLTESDLESIKYWGETSPIYRVTEMALKVLSTYNVSIPRSTRIMSIINKGIYDSTIITWFLKYYYNCPRPVQIDKEFKTQMPTEESPSYPSILSVISAVVSEILSYYFPEEKAKLQGFSEEAANSKVLSGVNFKSDVVEGIKLGKQIGNLIIGEACKEKDLKGNYVDIKIKKFLNAPITKR